MVFNLQRSLLHLLRKNFLRVLRPPILYHAVANENEIALFVNNVRQQPGSGKAYTATGTALTLSAATASTDTMYCVFLGRALQTVVPATNSITAAMVGNDLISGKDALAATPADTDELLISDAGTLKRIDFSHLKTGITEADQYRYTASSGGISGDITSNLERVDSNFDKIGTGITNSSGIFSFPSTGIYLITVQAQISFVNEADNGAYISLYITADNSNYNERARAYAGSNSTSNNSQFSVYSSNMVDVTDTSNVKVKFTASSFDSQTFLEGDTDKNFTVFTFIRLGDT